MCYIDIYIYTECFKKLISFHSFIDVFIFTDIEMPFTGGEKALCVLEHARSQSNKTVIEHAFVREISKQSPTAMQISSLYKQLKEKGCFCMRKGSDRPKTSEDTSSVFLRNLVRPMEFVAKNMSGNPDSTSNSVAHPDETLDNETLQATTRSDHDVREQAQSKPN